MGARHIHHGNTMYDTANSTWCPEYMQSLRSTFDDRQFARDALIDYIYSERRRVRKHVQGPAEGYHHPNEINGVRILRKGRGIPPQDRNKQQQQDEDPDEPAAFIPHRRGKAPGPDALGSRSSSSSGDNGRRILSYQGCIYPVDQVEMAWPHKVRAKGQFRPQEQIEQIWPSKGKKIINGRSHLHHGMFYAWNPDTTPRAVAATAATPAQDLQQQPEQQPRFGKRVAAHHNKSNVIFG